MAVRIVHSLSSNTTIGDWFPDAEKSKLETSAKMLELEMGGTAQVEQVPQTCYELGRRRT